MTGCELIKCPHYKDGKCHSTVDYVNKYTGEPMCHLNDNAVTRDLPKAGASAERISSVVRSNATTGWISVKDRLPEINPYPCIIYDNESGITMGLFLNLKFLNKGNCKVLEEVTHWMPLPDAPEV